MSRAVRTIRLSLPLWLLALGVAGCDRVNRVAEESFGLHLVQREGTWRVEAVSGREKIEQAVGSDNPDTRREAVNWLGEPARVDQQSVVKLLGVVLASDQDPTVRSAAARALGRSMRPEASEPLVAALEDKDRYVRLESTNALIGRKSDNVKRALMVRLARDEFVQVRVAAARGLGDYPERRVLESLIASLRDPDFAVQYESERSLNALTGFAFEYDPDAWSRWLNGLGPDGDPFAQAGRIPPSLQKPQPSLLDRMGDAARRSWHWWQADERLPQ
ncbi:MAG: hypothetical protein BIFFINMI_02415 [Phycisphaerae bacterium]|nr:hypothetical protein [Phycisphaerae bacterium]